TAANYDTTPTPFLTPTPFPFTGGWPVVRVTQSGGFGQGVLISSTEVLTAYHVVDSGGSIRAIFPASSNGSEEVRTAVLRGFNASDDIALLTITPFSGTDIDYASPVPTGTGNCAAGLGAVRNGDQVVMETTGDDFSEVGIFRIWGRRAIGVGDVLFKTDIAGTPGLSGSPLYGAGGRVLVGIVVQRDLALSNIAPLVAVDGCQVSSRLTALRAGSKQ
ncbi:MAG: serine protease, partial [Dehalococcoidia bacterium]